MKTVLFTILLCVAGLALPCAHAQQTEAHDKRFLEDKVKAEQGAAAAQYNLGLSYATGLGVGKDLAEAAKWYRKSAEQNHAMAQTMLGGLYANGLGVAKDHTEAVKWFRKGADQNQALAQNALGFCHASGQGVVKDYTEAVKWYRKAAEQNDAQAQHNLGYSYYNGQGVVQDYAEAVGWFRKANEQDYAPSQYQLGLCCYDGHGVPKSHTEAYAWWSLAANTHALAAQGRAALGQKMSPEQLFDGQKRTKELRVQIEARLERTGQAQQADAAHRQFLEFKAKAEKGDVEAQRNLGTCYTRGHGVAKDYAESVKWFRKAAEQGDAPAQYHLGQCYDGGQGTAKDIVEAYAWMNLAANTLESAADGLVAVELQMTTQQIGAGRLRSEELRKQIEARLERAGKAQSTRP